MVGRKKAVRPVLFLLFLLVLLRSQACLGAEGHVFDLASLFTSSETRRLEELAQELEETYNMNVLMLTTDDARGRSSAGFAENFYERGGYDQNGKKGGIVLLIDMDNREINLVTSGNMIYFITDAREERIYDAGYGSVSAGLYGAGMMDMLKQTQAYLKSGIPDNQYTYDVETGEIVRYRSLTMAELVTALLAALLLAGGSCFLLKRKYGVVEEYQYQASQEADINVTDRQDVLVNEFVTSRRVPRVTVSGGGGRSSGGSGRTTVHRSSGGRSYGGGHGRKF